VVLTEPAGGNRDFVLRYVTDQRHREA
jgi:hypothetical protein